MNVHRHLRGQSLNNLPCKNEIISGNPAAGAADKPRMHANGRRLAGLKQYISCLQVASKIRFWFDWLIGVL
jgi:hypothetical protein